METTTVYSYWDEDRWTPQNMTGQQSVTYKCSFQGMRFWNHEMLGQFESVKERIWLELENTD